MIGLHDDLLEVLDAVEIESLDRYSILGEPREVGERHFTETSLPPEPTLLVVSLGRDLYERLYFRPSAQRALPRTDVVAQRDFAAALSAANSGLGAWQPGWTVRRIDHGGMVVVAKDDVEFWSPLSDVMLADGTIEPMKGCRVRVAKELRQLKSGFQVAIGDSVGSAGAGSENGDSLDRYYWHLRVNTAVRFMGATTSRLNAIRVPFHVKLLNDPNAYHRADAGVLYASRNHRGLIGTIIAEIHSIIASGLRSPVPLFTRRLADGLGFAEDPNSALSFGEHRCQLIAAALWESFIHGEVQRDARSATVAAAYLKAGLDPRRPYRGPGSLDDETLDTLESQISLAKRTAVNWKINEIAPMPAASPAAASPLEAAKRIGSILCRSTYWDVDGLHCNWMGRSTAEALEPGGPITQMTSAVGPDLYGGSAGIALFLTQLHALSGNPESRRVAIGAIARSIRQLDRLPTTEPVSPLSLYCGHLGVAYVAQTVAELTEHSGLAAQARSILDRVADSIACAHELDVIGGNAGAIPALLQMSRYPGLGQCRELAITLGEELCRSATRRGSARVWLPKALANIAASTRPMAGMAHGAAGFGVALFEVYAATGRTEFLETARGAFAFMDTLFDPNQRNWADQGASDGAFEIGGMTSTFSSGWCHGAPGIGLAQLRAAALDPARSEYYLAMARRAVATTLEAIEDHLEDTRSDASLCHGLSGLGEVVLIASQMLDEPTYHSRAVDLAEALIERHASSDDWPSGAPSGGPNPSLMLGLAGIGYWLLRLHDPAKVPPILLLIP